MVVAEEGVELAAPPAAWPRHAAAAAHRAPADRDAAGTSPATRSCGRPVRTQSSDRVWNQRATGLGDGMADGSAAGELAVETVQQKPRGFDMNGMAHGQHAADTRLDQPWSHRAEHGRLPHRGAAAGFQHDERDFILREQVAKLVGADKIGLRFAGTVIRLFKTEGAEL